MNETAGELKAERILSKHMNRMPNVFFYDKLFGFVTLHCRWVIYIMCTFQLGWLIGCEFKYKKHNRLKMQTVEES